MAEQVFEERYAKGQVQCKGPEEGVYPADQKNGKVLVWPEGVRMGEGSGWKA